MEGPNQPREFPMLNAARPTTESAPQCLPHELRVYEMTLGKCLFCFREIEQGEAIAYLRYNHWFHENGGALLLKKLNTRHLHLPLYTPLAISRETENGRSLGIRVTCALHQCVLEQFPTSTILFYPTMETMDEYREQWRTNAMSDAASAARIGHEPQIQNQAYEESLNKCLFSPCAGEGRRYPPCKGGIIYFPCKHWVHKDGGPLLFKKFDACPLCTPPPILPENENRRPLGIRKRISIALKFAVRCLRASVKERVTESEITKL